jgi:hypothetical protein
MPTNITCAIDIYMVVALALRLFTPSTPPTTFFMQSMCILSAVVIAMRHNKMVSVTRIFNTILIIQVRHDIAINIILAPNFFNLSTLEVSALVRFVATLVEYRFEPSNITVDSAVYLFLEIY